MAKKRRSKGSKSQKHKPSRKTVSLDRALHKKLRIAAASKGTKIGALLDRAVRIFVKSRSPKQKQTEL